MILILVLSVICCTAISSASVVHYAPPATLYTHAIPVTSHQYLSQDTLGQYSYGYTGVGSSKSEIKLLDGVTRGAYSYVDANGKLQTVKYVADDLNGFQVAASNLPVHRVEELQPVQDTEDVRIAKENHLAALREAERKAAEQPDPSEADSSEHGEEEQQQPQPIESVHESNENDDDGHANGGASLALITQKDDEPQSNGYRTSYVHVSTPQNSYAYSIYDYPHSTYLSNGYALTYADAFSNYRHHVSPY